MAATDSAQPAITCWSCGSQVPLKRVTVLDGHRTVTCQKCGRTNSLDQAGH